MSLARSSYYYNPKPKDPAEVKADIDEIKDRARSEGYDEAKRDYQIWYYCAVCGKRIDMEPNSDSHKAMIGYMKEHGWAHASCHSGTRT